MSRKSTEKAQVNLRLSPEARLIIAQAAYLRKKAHSQVVEEALQEYAKNHNLGGRYQLTLTDTMVVLLKLERDQISIVEASPRNGVSPQELQTRWVDRLKEPVMLVDQTAGEKS